MTSVCAICLSDLSEEPTSKLSCQHEFHSDCIIKMFQSMNKTTCPLCRQDGYNSREYAKIYRTHSRILKKDICNTLSNGNQRIKNLRNDVIKYKVAANEMKKHIAQLRFQWSKIFKEMKARGLEIEKQLNSEIKDKKRKFVSSENVKMFLKKRAKVERIYKKIKNQSSEICQEIPGLHVEDLVHFSKDANTFWYGPQFCTVNHFATKIFYKFDISFDTPRYLLKNPKKIKFE